MTIKGVKQMDWNLVSIEEEIEREKAEREKVSSKIVPAATGASLSFGKVLLYVFLGIIIFKIFVGFISILSR